MKARYQAEIPIVDVSQYMPERESDIYSQADRAEALRHYYPPNVSIGVSDEQLRVPMTAAEAEEFEESLRPHVEKLLDEVRSGRLRHRLLGECAVEQTTDCE